MTDNQKNIIGTILLNMSASTLPITEEMISNLVDMNDNMNTMMYGTPKLTPEEREEVINALHAALFVRIDRGHFVKENDHTPWYMAAKAENSSKFWDRYRLYLLKEKHWNGDTINELDKTTDEIMDLLGNPDQSGGFMRRGLCIGDVQSGKTSTYIGLINKAADAHYRVIILLTGTIEKLRRQTQQRIDEGFIGLDSYAFTLEKGRVQVGVGSIDATTSGWAVTSTSSDFNAATAKKVVGQLSNISAPVIFVLKKNKSVLEKLEHWLRFYNINPVTKKIDLPMLLIDDEADNASVMKLSVVTPEKAMVLIPNIAKYANKQNKVSDADFFSNHAFHVRMEDFSRRVLAPAVMGNQYGTYWYYERTRGQYKQEQSRMTKAERDKFLIQNPKSQMFTKTDLAKFYNIYRQLPHQVSTGAQKNFIQFAEWASAAWEKDETVFNERYFRQIVCLDILYKKVDYIVKHASWYEMGYKAQVVTYTLSYIFHRIGEECPGYAFDFKSVWNQQTVSHATEVELERIAEAMYNHLISPDREVQNVTEWAKREACWKKARTIAIPLGAKFKKELVSIEEEATAKKNARQEQKQENSASAMIQVAEYGVENWKALLSWGIQNRIFTPQEISFLKAAIAMEAGKFPSEKQCGRILQVLAKAREESWPN